MVKKKILLFSLIIMFIVIGATCTVYKLNNAKYSNQNPLELQKTEKIFADEYSVKLKKARALLADEYSKEVFDFFVELWNDFPRSFNNKKADLLTNRYERFLNPDVPINENDNLIDGGACFYRHKELFDSIIEKTRIIAFEPNEELSHIIEDKLHNFNNIRIYRLGLWNKNTVLPLYTGYSLDHSTIKKDWFKYDRLAKESNEEIRENYVELVKLDDFLKKQNVGKIDYINLDIEGSELEALKGAVHTIKKYRPKMSIAINHHPTELFTVILYLNSLNLNYKYYLGLHPVYTGVLYVKP